MYYEKWTEELGSKLVAQCEIKSCALGTVKYGARPEPEPFTVRASLVLPQEPGFSALHHACLDNKTFVLDNYMQSGWGKGSGQVAIAVSNMDAPTAIQEARDKLLEAVATVRSVVAAYDAAMAERLAVRARQDADARRIMESRGLIAPAN